MNRHSHTCKQKGIENNNNFEEKLQEAQTVILKLGVENSRLKAENNRLKAENSIYQNEKDIAQKNAHKINETLATRSVPKYNQYTEQYSKFGCF